MKSIDLEEIKSQVVKKFGYTKPYVSLTLDDKALLSDEIAIEYAKQCCNEQIKACAEKAKEKDYVSHTLIISTPNVVTTK